MKCKTSGMKKMKAGGKAVAGAKMPMKAPAMPKMAKGGMVARGSGCATRGSKFMGDC